MSVAELPKTGPASQPKAPNVARGLEGIIADTTRLSDVIGDKGQLVYSGYDINDLAGKVSYKEVVYLLWKGKLPNRRELDEFMHALRAERQLPEPVIEFIKSAPKDADPMDVMRTAISMLGLYDPDIHKEATREINERRARSITAKIGVIAAYFHRARQGKSLPPVRDDLTEAEHFLYLICGEPQPQEATDALDVAFVLHADHGMNASTFSARVTISTLSDFYSAITSAIGTLKGPLHGGANEGVIHMLQEIGEEKNVDAYIEKQLAQKKKIMGIGHRVYKTVDPRAPHLRAMARKLERKNRRTEMDSDVGADRTVDEREEKSERQRRFLFRYCLLLVRYSDRSLHTDLCYCPVLRLVRAGARTTGRQSSLPAAEPVHRRTGWQKGHPNRRARVDTALRFWRLSY